MSIAALLQAAEYLERRERGKFSTPPPPPPPPSAAPDTAAAATAVATYAAANTNRANTVISAADRVNTVVFFAEAEHGYASPMPITIDLKGKRQKTKKSQGNRTTHNELEKNRPGDSVPPRAVRKPGDPLASRDESAVERTMFSRFAEPDRVPYLSTRRTVRRPANPKRPCGSPRLQTPSVIVGRAAKRNCRGKAREVVRDFVPGRAIHSSKTTSMVDYRRQLFRREKKNNGQRANGVHLSTCAWRVVVRGTTTHTRLTSYRVTFSAVYRAPLEIAVFSHCTGLSCVNIECALHQPHVHSSGVPRCTPCVKCVRHLSRSKLTESQHWFRRRPIGEPIRKYATRRAAGAAVGACLSPGGRSRHKSSATRVWHSSTRTVNYDPYFQYSEEINQCVSFYYYEI
ncbi:Hypothetical protein CINCED_3A007561 [Cinara cedri]|uniref:Uncharacterized protein n=1 Tax=Cinara cedri TaxID=506608 RepID=A0A5E4MIT6_9HEMI|nr:Hypothetical protein CINCED_3A007561 [Cinara cedri]